VIRIEPEWIPREQNELADFYSLIVDYDDWRCLTQWCLHGWIAYGGITQLIDLQALEMLKLIGSTPKKWLLLDIKVTKYREIISNTYYI